MINKVKSKISLVMIFIALASGCAGVNKNYIDMAARPHIKKVDGFLAVPQDEIYAEINRSNTTAAAGGGLLFAIIDSAIDNSRTKDAESLIQPIRDILINYDYASRLQANIAERLTAIEWLNLDKLELERFIVDERLNNKIQGSNASAILFMTANYNLTPDFDAVETNVSMIMFPNKEVLAQFKEKQDSNENPVDNNDNIYRNTVKVTIPLNVPGTKAENARTLAQNSLALLEEALDESAKKIAMKIAIDIESDETQER